VRRVWFAVGGLALAIVAILGGVVFFVPRNGQPLPERERTRLLEQAHLPQNFPVHPGARRMTQPDQGGISYAIHEPVNVVVLWHRATLEQTGYAVFADPVGEQEDELPRWVHFRNDTGAQGSIIVRGVRWGPARATEVKILSRADPRLAPPPLPESVLRP
jgi:hypothetical protein